MTHSDACNLIKIALSECGVMFPTTRVVGLFCPVRNGRPQGSPKFINVPGEADVQGILPPTGRIIGVEVKVGRDTVKPGQEHWRDVFISAGGIYVLSRFTAKIDGCATLIARLAELGYPKVR